MQSWHMMTDPAVLVGKPTIAGTRISVQLILEKLRDGWTIANLLDDYPHLSREQIVAALTYAAEHMGASAAPLTSSSMRTSCAVLPSA